MSGLYPLNSNELGIDKAINEWGPNVREKLPSIRGRLLQDHGIPHPDILDMVD